jgi:hypothetical protein
MADVKFKVKPITIPNYLIIESPPSTRQEGLKESPKISVANASRELILELCEEFKVGMLKKAGF